jgi:uncharacterized protein
MKPERQLLDDLLERIRGVVEPTRVILFGSAARGEMRPDSDLDVLVEVADSIDPNETECRIYRALIGFGVATDVIVMTEDDLRRYGDVLGLIYRPALREGRELYAA